MSGEINVISRTQIISVEPLSGAISIINAGPMGPSGEGALTPQADKTILGNNSGTVQAPSALTAAQVMALLSDGAAADFSLNAHKLTELSNGSAASDAVAFGQLANFLSQPAWVPLGNLGATETITGIPGTLHQVYGSLNQDCVITVSMQSNEQIVARLDQDNVGGHAATFVGVDRWTTSSGLPPDLTIRGPSPEGDEIYFSSVNSVVTGYWLTENPNQAQQLINAQTGTSYTLLKSDIGKLITLSNTNPISLILPQDSACSWPIGCWAEGLQLGAGQVSVDQGTGATVHPTTPKTRVQYSRIFFQKIAANTWLVSGDTE